MRDKLRSVEEDASAVAVRRCHSIFCVSVFVQERLERSGLKRGTSEEMDEVRERYTAGYCVGCLHDT